MNVYRLLIPAFFIASSSIVSAQSEVSIEAPRPVPFAGTALRPFHLERRVVAPAKLSNSPRLESLVRSGNLYLSVQDVIALVLENNLDIAIQRYVLLMAREGFCRTQG